MVKTVDIYPCIWYVYLKCIVNWNSYCRDLANEHYVTIGARCFQHPLPVNPAHMTASWSEEPQSDQDLTRLPRKLVFCDGVRSLPRTMMWVHRHNPRAHLMPSLFPHRISPLKTLAEVSLMVWHSVPCYTISFLTRSHTVPSIVQTRSVGSW